MPHFCYLAPSRGCPWGSLTLPAVIRKGLKIMNAQATRTTAIAVAMSFAPAVLAQTQTQQHKLFSPQAQAGDRFGGAVDADNGLVAVGGRVFDDALPNSGRVVLYNAQSGTVVREFHADNFPIFDGFGAAIDLHGPLLVVGAPLDDTNGIDAGAVYLFESDTGEPLGKILPIQVETGDRFGSAVATNGSIVMISSPGDDENGTNAGRVFIFDIANPAAPVQLARFQRSPAAGKSFGSTLALQGNIAVVGTPNAGEVFMYNVDMTNPSNPALFAELQRPEGQADRFGYSVAISGSRILVGTHDTGNGRGEAHLFEFGFPTNPVHRSTFSPDGDGSISDFGYSVALDGDVAVIGAADDTSDGLSAGSAYIFDISDTSSPVQTHQLIASDSQSNKILGFDVAISGDTVVAGAYGDDTFGSQTGAAYVFNIALPCSQADFAEPLGLLDLADIVGFVTAFSASDPAADLDTNGLFDLDDITEFVSMFNAGCP